MVVWLILVISIIASLIVINKNDICYNHKDKNRDMLCDKCSDVLAYNEYVSPSTAETMVDEISIIATGNMMDGTTLKVKNVQDTARYDANITEAFGEDFVKLKYALDIKLMANNKEYEPSIYKQIINLQLANLDISENESYAVLHIKDNGTSEIISVNTNENNMAFKTTSFSVFLIIQVAGKNVSFAGEHITIYDMNFNEIVEGTTVASNTDFEFLVMTDDGYGIKPPAKGETNITSSGVANSKKYLIKSITKDMEINIETVLAPKIVTQPKAVKVKNEDTAVLKVVAENTTTYQWQVRRNRDVYWENAIGTGTTSSTFKPNVRNYGGYEYRCLVGNDAFTLDDRIASDSVLVVSVCDLGITYELPVILSQKASNTKVKIGEGRATYEVTAQGKDLAFTWQYKNRINGVWQNVGSIGTVKNTTISNENGIKVMKSTLTTAIASNSLLFAEFRCRVSNNHYISDESVLSDNMIYLAVSDDNETKFLYKEIDFINQTISRKVLIGEMAEFSVEASGVDTYKWQYKVNQEEEFWQDVDSKLGTNSDIATGYDSKALKIDTSQILYNGETEKYENDLNGYLFRCLVSSSAIPDAIRDSNVAMLVCVDEQEYANVFVYKKFGVITLTVSSENGKKGEEMLKINKSLDNTREITMNYIGDLLEPTVEVSIARKIKDIEYEKLKDIEKYIQVYNITNSENLQIAENKECYYQDGMTAKEQYRFTFLNALPTGTYKLTFTLKDITNKNVATEAFIVEVE